MRLPRRSRGDRFGLAIFCRLSIRAACCAHHVLGLALRRADRADAVAHQGGDAASGAAEDSRDTVAGDMAVVAAVRATDFEEGHSSLE